MPREIEFATIYEATDDLVSAFLSPGEGDDSCNDEGRVETDYSPELPTQDRIDTSLNSSDRPHNEQLATSLHSSSNMSDSIVGSDVDEQDSPSSPSSPHSFPEPVADEMSSLEESP